MRHALLIAIASAALAGAAHAQNTSTSPSHPDFSGTWTVDHVDVQDKPNANFGGGGGGFGGFGGGGGRGGFGRRGGFGGGRRGGGYGGGNGGQRPGAGREGVRQSAGLSQGDTLRVTQSPERLIVTRLSPDGDIQTSYTLDGKETKNHPSPEVEMKSKTKWEGVALVTDSEQTTELPNGGGKFSTKTREILSLSDDGQTLTSTMTADSLRGKRTIVATLKKSSAPPAQ